MPIFEGSSHFVASGSYVDSSLNLHVHEHSAKNVGIDALRKASLPEAIHDSGARELLPCFPGTREGFIRDITGWGSGGWKERKARVLWLQGPAGVGKSALAQTCVERLGDKLSAAFFFSRPNQWNKSAKFLPTIIYQLAVKHPAYADLVDAKVQRDPFVLEKVFEVQFQELLIGPLRTLSSRGHGIGEDTVIIIDGLDECDDEDAQRVIIEVITTSVHQQTIPFLWAFFSRPEPHIVAAFSSEQAKEVCWPLTLPVSHDADQDIEAYLRDSFKRIRNKYNLPVEFNWPSEEDTKKLVDQSGGLFVYAVSAARYIAGNAGADGPEAKLESILALGGLDNNKNSGKAPLSNLDRFYILIMQQIPKDILPNTLLLLFTQVHRHTPVKDLLINCSILGFSLTTFYAAINNLHSVLKVQKSNGFPSDLSFYHASFSDFLCDVESSTAEFCLETTDIYNRFYSKCVDALHRLSDTNDVNERANVLSWPNSKTRNENAYSIMKHLFWLPQSPLLCPRADVLQQFSQINWNFAAEWYGDWVVPTDWVEAFFDKIPKDWRGKIIRPLRRGLLDTVLQLISAAKRGEVMKAPNRRGYIVGSGRNKVLLVPDVEKNSYMFLAS